MFLQLPAVAATTTHRWLAIEGHRSSIAAFAGSRWLGLGIVIDLFGSLSRFVDAMYLAIGQADDQVSKIAMLEMAMPPMLGASIIAMEHDLEPDLVALMIGIGVPLSITDGMAGGRLSCSCKGDGGEAGSDEAT